MTGRDLRAWMRRNDYTIESLARALGVTERTIYRWRVLPEIPPHVDLALEALESRRTSERGTELRRGRSSA